MSWAMVVAAVGSAVIQQIMKPSQSSAPATPAPTLAAPTPMPTPGDDAAKAQKRKSLMDQMARQGRASTILTDQTGTSDKLGA